MRNPHPKDTLALRRVSSTEGRVGVAVAQVVVLLVVGNLSNPKPEALNRSDLLIGFVAEIPGWVLGVSRLAFCVVQVFFGFRLLFFRVSRSPKP